MNCTKCPITDECKVAKMTLQSDYYEGISIPTKVIPNDPDNCLLVKVIATVEELKNQAMVVE